MENSNDLSPAIPDENTTHWCERETETVLLGDTDETLMLVVVDPTTGEVVAIQDDPGQDATDAATYARAVCDYLGPRLTAAQAGLAALEAEKAEWQKRIDAQFDTRIKREKSLIAFLKMEWHKPLADYARTALAGGKSRTLTIGLLKLSFRAKPGKLEILDEQAAQDYLTVVCPDALQTKTSVMVSRIPEELKADLPAHSGLTMTPASEVFEVK